MFTDNHMHTKAFSSDGKMSFEELLQAAIESGLPGASITEHYDMDYEITEEEMPFIFNIDEYVKTFSNWRSSCPKDFHLGMGIEIGYQEHLDNRINDLLSSQPFDSVILSEHVFHGADIYYRKEVFEAMTDKEIYSEYISILSHMAKQIQKYDIIGHFDYIDRYNPRPNSSIRYSHCPDEFDELLKTIISRGKSLEINTGSIRKKLIKKESMYLPDKDILLRYRELGGTLISLGSDSHTSDTLGWYFSETADYLRSLGFNSNTYFIDHKPYQEPL